jgi:predicted PurR-regulated permease PerM
MATTELYQGLTFLSYSTGIIVILVGIMLVKVLFDISKLTRNIDETATIIKMELEPTLKNINKSVEIISNVIIKTDEGIQKVRKFISKTPLQFIGKLSKFTGKATKGFFGGLCSAFKMFSKK